MPRFLKMNLDLLLNEFRLVGLNSRRAVPGELRPRLGATEVNRPPG